MNDAYHKFCHKYEGGLYTHGICVVNEESGCFIYDTSRKYRKAYSFESLCWSVVNVFDQYSFQILLND